MICSHPYRAGGQEFPCRKCLPCRINSRRLWSARLLWEACLPEYVDKRWFVTLTYSDEHLPADKSVSKRAVQLYLKRLRTYSGDKIRFFAVGEYGERTWRAHYHLCIFGLRHPKYLTECWPFGFVHIGLVESGSVEYITGYCTKGFTRSRPELEGRAPEFALMSTRPGLGAGVVDRIPLEVNGVALADVLSGQDVAWGLRNGGRVKPMGTYLRNRLRGRLGRSKGVPAEDMRRRAVEYWTRMKVESEVELMKGEKVQSEQKAESWFSIQRAKRGKV